MPSVLVIIDSDKRTAKKILQSYTSLQIDRPTILDMTPPKKSLLPTWRAFARRGPVYASIETNSGSSALETPEFSDSLFVT